ncbi:HDOD domain-containing protein [Baekduia sp. Peel2402]|uniref:HDOD domain-containing protein n=1 Tax=Baekduia sp. Peel2402 TaxID=3458296 RepID=UPI00403EE145
MSSPSTTIGAVALPKIDQAIADLGDLPVLDRSLLRVRELSDDPEASTHELVEALQSDASLAANLLVFANSAANAHPVRASSIHQAVMLIGRRSVGRIALEAQVCTFFEQAPGSGGVARGQLHVHAVQVGACAAELARRAKADAGAAHLAGLLHDLGKLVLPGAFGAAEVDATAASAPAGPLRPLAERDAFGVDHAMAGARFAASAGLPPDIVDAIAGHHGAGEDHSAVTRCVQVANAMVALIGGHPADHELLRQGLDDLGLTMADIEQVATTALPSAVAEAAAPSSLAEQVSRLEREARTDELTDLLNRRYWSLAAREQLAARGASVLICDVDHFKRINDFHGHHTGDFVLSEIGRILSANGLAGRLGGDEFALITTEPDPAATAAERILAAVNGAFADPALQVSVSIGSATALEAGADLSELLRLADEALYTAKGAGRGVQRAA